MGGRAWAHRWATHTTHLLPALRDEIEREFERLLLAARQIRVLDVQQQREVRSGGQLAIARLAPCGYRHRQCVSPDQGTVRLAAISQPP